MGEAKCGCTEVGHEWHDGECGMPLLRPASVEAGACGHCRKGSVPQVGGLAAAAARIRSNERAARRTRGVVR